MTVDSKHSPAAKRRRTLFLAAACVLVFAVATTITVLLLRPPEPDENWSDTDVPLGVEEAIIVRYTGPRLVARPYRRGASVNVRIAGEVQDGAVRVYDIRYVVNLPGEFDLTAYLTSADGTDISDLPSFKVRGLTSLTKDIETRIQEIEDVGVDVWHWYHETLAALGVLWIVWLLGLIFIGRPKRPATGPPPPPEPTIAQRIERYLQALARGELTVEEKAEFEVLLLKQWRGRLGLQRHRMAAACRGIHHSDALGPVYANLTAWLHDPHASADPDEFLEAYAQRAGKGLTAQRPGVAGLSATTEASSRIGSETCAGRANLEGERPGGTP